MYLKDIKEIHKRQKSLAVGFILFFGCSHSNSFSDNSIEVYTGLSENLVAGVVSNWELSRGVVLESRTEVGKVSGVEMALNNKTSNRFSASPYSYLIGAGLHINNEFENHMPGLMFRAGLGMSLSGYKENINYDVVIRVSGDRPHDNKDITHRIEFTIANKFSWNSFFSFGFYHHAKNGGESGVFLGLKK